jgi:enamine deaminase RidA (YjgF/YER057c/UK114 family)
MNRSLFLEKCKASKLILPTLLAPIASYCPYKFHGQFLYISGQLPLENGRIVYEGAVGEACSFENALKAAELCALNMLAQVNSFWEQHQDLSLSCLKITGFVQASKGFSDVHKVVNGASDLIKQIMGDDGIHTRSAVGVQSLPLNAAVEIESIFAVR